MARRRLRATVTIGTGALLTTLVGGTFAILDRTRATAWHAATRSVERSGRVAENIVNRQILGVDSALASLPALLAGAGPNGGAEAANRVLHAYHVQTLAFRDLVLIGPDGRVWAAARALSRRRPPPVAAALAAEPASATLAVHGPLPTPATGDWALFLSRPVELAGRGAVVAVAEVPLAALTAALAEIGDVPGLTIAIRRTDGRLLASLPHDEAALRRQSATGATPEVERPEAGHAEAGDAIEVRRPTLYAGVEVVVGLDLAKALADWARDRDRLLVAAALAAAAVLGFAALLLAALRQHETLEARAQGARATLDDAIAAMSDGFVMWDAEDRLVTWNEHYLHLYRESAPFIRVGALFEDIIRQGAAVGQYPQAAGDPERFVQETVAWHRGAAGTIERLLPDGRWLLVTERRTANGGIVGIRTDITALKHALDGLAAANAREQATMADLRRQNERFDAALGNMVHGLTMIDAGYQVTVINARFCEVYGLPPGTIAPGASVEDVVRHTAAVRGLSQDTAWARTLVLLRRREPFRREHALLDGRVVAMSCTPARNGGWVTVHEDVSARKHAEAVLAQAKREAEAARREAERASEAKTEFLASMSHEIRTPLNGILGYTDLLLDDDLGPEQRRNAERIQSSGAALLTVVDDILDFSKIEAGQITLAPGPFALAALVEEASAIVRTSAARKRLALEVVLDPALPAEVVGDHDRLRQIVLNLLNNAIKFTPVGSVTLRVEDAGEGRVRFSVSDTGIGIPPEKTHLLFERFSQIDGSIRREFGGTGLGLAISKRLVALMDGTIGVESRPYERTTFWFVVPLAPATAAAAATRAAAPVEPARAARILLVEDVVINRELARSVLERAGHGVDVVGDGADAIMAVQTGFYDLVLMDVQMPGMDGLTATRRIRALDHPARDLPIVAMTANVLPAQVAACREAGMDDHVGKPFRREELHAAVARWAGVRAAPAAADAAVLEMGPDTLDEAAYAELVALMGTDAVLRLLAALADRLAETFGDERLTASDRVKLAADAHAMVSAAGALGFAALARLSADLEMACLAGSGVEAVAARAALARQSALARIAMIRAAA